MKQNNADTTVEAINDHLTAAGYETEARPRLDMVKVHNPADAEAMYERINEVCDSFDVHMTAPTVFQIIVE
jgi:hypothetical protein